MVPLEDGSGVIYAITAGGSEPSHSARSLDPLDARLLLASLGPRRLLKSMIERGLRAIRPDVRRSHGRTLILAYHNVVPDRWAGRADRSLHLSQSAFLRHLDLLQTTCHVLRLQDAVQTNRSPDALHLAITFDDAYRGAIRFALPELASRGLPSAIFVAPGLLGHRRFWWDDIAVPDEGLPHHVRQLAIQEFAGREDLVRLYLQRSRAGDDLPPVFGCADSDELLDCARCGIISIGAHSWSHPNLDMTAGDALTQELARPLAWLQELDVPTLPMIAYPYGIASPAVQRAARAAGYVAGFRVDGGWMPAGSVDRLWLPRFNVPAGLSENGLYLRLARLIRL